MSAPEIIITAVLLDSRAGACGNALEIRLEAIPALHSQESFDALRRLVGKTLTVEER